VEEEYACLKQGGTERKVYHMGGTKFRGVVSIKGVTTPNLRKKKRKKNMGTRKQDPLKKKTKTGEKKKERQMRVRHH